MGISTTKIERKNAEKLFTPKRLTNRIFSKIIKSVHSRRINHPVFLVNSPQGPKSVREVKTNEFHEIIQEGVVFYGNLQNVEFVYHAD